MRLNELISSTQFVIVEALKPSEYRKFAQLFNRERYKDIFHGQFRLYFPVENTNPVRDRIESFLKRFKYSIEDYKTGTVKKEGDQRVFKIGKVLSELNPALLKMFNEDKSRQGGEISEGYNLMVVISRHPYDLAGMSTDRAWSSCMNIHTGINKRYVTCDVKEGTLIAYLTTKDDRNLKHPLGRMLIKPFMNAKTKQRILVLVQEGGETKGKGEAEITEIVEKWLSGINKISPGEYRLIKSLYPEQSQPRSFDELHEYRDVTDAMQNRVVEVATTYLKGKGELEPVEWLKRLGSVFDIDLLQKHKGKITTNPKGAIFEKEYQPGTKVDIDMIDDKIIKNLLDSIPEELHAKALQKAGIS